MVKVLIEIRDELVNHWGGVVIGKFTGDGNGTVLGVKDVVLPGFDYKNAGEGEKATFTITTDNGKPIPKKAARAKIIPIKKGAKKNNARKSLKKN